MSRSWCERESDVVQGLRTGQLSSELRSHVLGCSICTETQGVARSMLRVAAVVKEENEPIAAGLVWRRVEKQRKEIALKRAARPLIFMRALSVVCVVLSVAWGVRYLWRSVFFWSFLWTQRFAEQDRWFGCCDCGAGDCDWSWVPAARQQAVR